MDTPIHELADHETLVELVVDHQRFFAICEKEVFCPRLAYPPERLEIISDVPIDLTHCDLSELRKLEVTSLANANLTFDMTSKLKRLCGRVLIDGPIQFPQLDDKSRIYLDVIANANSVRIDLYDCLARFKQDGEVPGYIRVNRAYELSARILETDYLLSGCCCEIVFAYEDCRSAASSLEQGKMPYHFESMEKFIKKYGSIEEYLCGDQSCELPAANWETSA